MSKLEPSPTVRKLLDQLTLAEKIGQMTQVEKGSVTPQEVSEYALGSVLSGGGGNPHPNTPALWREMVEGFQKAALESRLGVPLLYGSDAVHGHNNVKGTTIFPHNIAVGMTGEPELARCIERATALECVATGVRWTFAPAVSIPSDPRWGRTFEGYAQTSDVVSQFAVAFIKGLKGEAWCDPTAVLPSVKHYVADGAARWGSSTRVDREALELDRTLAMSQFGEQFVQLVEQGAWMIDQGVSDIDEAELREVHLPPYRAALAAGALNVMASYSSWGGLKLHAHRYLLTDVLKGELGFEGFIVSDWEAIDQIDTDFYTCVTTSINAGLDMVMVPFEFRRFMQTLTRAVEAGDVPVSRIDDAVTRILKVKDALGLFDTPLTDARFLAKVGCREHRALAREVARKSQVLLKNEGVLPLSKGAHLLVTGAAADSLGYQCGGWTISWMGGTDHVTEGTTLLKGIRDAVSEQAKVDYSPDGSFAGSEAAVGVAVIAEEPYAEGMGDRSDLHLSEAQLELIRRTREHCDKLLVILLSGRPLIVTEELANWDAFIAAWLPGSEGAGVADVLFGDYPFTGKLSYDWPKAVQGEPLWATGYGLGESLTV